MVLFLTQLRSIEYTLKAAGGNLSIASCFDGALGFLGRIGVWTINHTFFVAFLMSHSRLSYSGLCILEFWDLGFRD